MATYYGRKYKLLEFRHHFKEFFLAVRIALKSQTLGKPNAERPLLVAMVDGESFHGGMCDRFKGILTLYAYCKQRGLPRYTYPFHWNGFKPGMKCKKNFFRRLRPAWKWNFDFRKRLAAG